jgi:thiol-disulfide isomerase/thioredoxin
VLLPLAELAVAVALVFPPSARWAALAAIALLGAFVVGIANAMAHGRAPDCHCFGQLHSEPAGRGTLARNAVLAAAAGTVAAFGPAPAVDSWVADRSAFELVAVVATLAVAALVARWLRAWSHARERTPRPSGRPVGSGAPSFALRGVAGEERTLDELCARGLPVVLVFVSPQCGPCRELLPQLAQWHARLATSVTIAVLSEGTAEANAPLVDGHGFDDVLLQERGEVYRAYGLREGTPAAVVVRPDRTIASVAVAGGPAIEELIRLTLHRSDEWARPSVVG